MNKLHFWDVSPIPAPDTKNLELYDFQTPGVPRRYWRREDFMPVSEYLMSFKEDLIKDFLGNHDSLEQAVKAKNLKSAFDNRPELNDIDISQVVLNNAQSDLKAWKVLTLRYENKRLGTEIENEVGDEYPTATKLLQQFAGNVGIATYSVIEPNSVIERHTGPENRLGEYLRIHIPLIIPEGEVFFECFGEIIKWDDIWGFNNQLIHSAHNYTDEYRLVFLIDLKFSAIGLDPLGPFNPKLQMHAKPFIK